MKKRKYFTTSEYVSALKLNNGRDNFYHTSVKDFMLFTNKKAADFDAEFHFDLYKKEGKKVKRPIVYKVIFERVK